MRDDAEFNDISIIPKDDGIEVKLGNARAVVLNREDAQFVCDNLYILLDEMELDEQEEEESHYKVGDDGEPN